MTQFSETEVGSAGEQPARGIAEYKMSAVRLICRTPFFIPISFFQAFI